MIIIWKYYFLEYIYSQTYYKLYLIKTSKIQHIMIYENIGWILVVSVLFVFVFWRLLLKGLATYLRFVRCLGKKHVGLLFRPLTPFMKINLDALHKYGHSMQQHYNMVKHNPQIKVIVHVTLLFTFIYMVDQGIIKEFGYRSEQFSNKNMVMLFANYITRDGILLANGERWKRSRKILSNIFHFDALKNRIPVMKEITQKFILHGNLQNQNVNIYELFMKMTGEVVVESLFGREYNQIKFEGGGSCEEQIKKILQIQTSSVAGNRLFYFLRRTIFGDFSSHPRFHTKAQKMYYERVMKFNKITRDYLKDCERKYQEKGSNTKMLPPFIQNYFDHKKQFGEGSEGEEELYYEMIQQLKSFLIAGQDTAAGTATNTLYYLAMYPQYQQQFYKIFTQGGDNFDLHNCRPLNNFINETLRFQSSVVNNLTRQITKSVKIGDMQLKKGDIIFSGLGTLMRNPKYFEDAETFNPGRFDTMLQNPFAFIPFYTGPHNCIGQHMALMEIRYFIREIILKYRVKRLIDLKIQSFMVITKPEDGHLVSFHLREHLNK